MRAPTEYFNHFDYAFAMTQFLIDNFDQIFGTRVYFGSVKVEDDSIMPTAFTSYSPSTQLGDATDPRQKPTADPDNALPTPSILLSFAEPEIPEYDAIPVLSPECCADMPLSFDEAGYPARPTAGYLPVGIRVQAAIFLPIAPAWSPIPVVAGIYSLVNTEPKVGEFKIETNTITLKYKNADLSAGEFYDNWQAGAILQIDDAFVKLLDPLDVVDGVFISTFEYLGTPPTDLAKANCVPFSFLIAPEIPNLAIFYSQLLMSIAGAVAVKFDWHQIQSTRIESIEIQDPQDDEIYCTAVLTWMHKAAIGPEVDTDFCLTTRFNAPIC